MSGTMFEEDIRETRDREGVHFEIRSGDGLGLRRTLTWEMICYSMLPKEEVIERARRELSNELFQARLAVRRERAEAERTGKTRIRLEGGPANGHCFEVPVGAGYLPPLTWVVLRPRDWSAIIATGEGGSLLESPLAREVVYRRADPIPGVDGIWRYVS